MRKKRAPSAVVSGLGSDFDHSERLGAADGVVWKECDSRAGNHPCGTHGDRPDVHCEAYVIAYRKVPMAGFA